MLVLKIVGGTICVVVVVIAQLVKSGRWPPRWPLRRYSPEEHGRQWWIAQGVAVALVALLLGLGLLLVR